MKFFCIHERLTKDVLYVFCENENTAFEIAMSVNKNFTKKSDINLFESINPIFSRLVEINNFKSGFFLIAKRISSEYEFIIYKTRKEKINDLL